VPRYQSNLTIARITIALVVLTGACTIATAPFRAWAARSRAEVSPDTVLVVGDGIGHDVVLAIGSIGSVAALAAGLAFLVWFRRAAMNAVAFDGERRWHLPSGAIGGFLIPILNFYRPYQIAREIEDASGASRSSVIAAWWATYLARSVVSVVAIFAMNEMIWPLLGAVVEALATYYCVRMILYLERVQSVRGRPIEQVADVFR
jgi:hypothetical protein